MSRCTKLLRGRAGASAGGASLVALLTALAAATAWAGASPTVSTGAATSIKDSSAVLTGSVNPQGSSTTYFFQYGLTSTYSATTKPHPAGAGTKAIEASSSVTGLIPGTEYHYRLVATSKFGTSTGADRTFTATGHPPAIAITGPPTAVGKTSVTLTGTINPNGEATAWTFQYGPTTTYGQQASGGFLNATSSAETVTSTLTGLAPGTLFHYRVIALHGSSVISTGADATFFTEPSPTPVPRVRAHTSPRHARHRPYVFTTRGSISHPSYIPASLTCAGNAFVEYFLGNHVIAYNVVAVQPNCTFSSTTRFRRVPGRHHRGHHLRVVAHFDGNGYLAPRFSSSQNVTAG
jgi:phosphodiesterase/alkaline phosphatase D-like protein